MIRSTPENEKRSCHSLWVWFACTENVFLNSFSLTVFFNTRWRLFRYTAPIFCFRSFHKDVNAFNYMPLRYWNLLVCEISFSLEFLWLSLASRFRISFYLSLSLFLFFSIYGGFYDRIIILFGFSFGVMLNFGFHIPHLWKVFFVFSYSSLLPTTIVDPVFLNSFLGMCSSICWILMSCI